MRDESNSFHGRSLFALVLPEKAEERSPSGSIVFPKNTCATSFEAKDSIAQDAWQKYWYHHNGGAALFKLGRSTQRHHCPVGGADVGILARLPFPSERPHHGTTPTLCSSALQSRANRKEAKKLNGTFARSRFGFVRKLEASGWRGLRRIF